MRNSRIGGIVDEKSQFHSKCLGKGFERNCQSNSSSSCGGLARKKISSRHVGPASPRATKSAIATLVALCDVALSRTIWKVSEPKD